MTGTNHHNSDTMSEPPKSRPLGNTERNWCRAVSSGTGITVLALQMSKPPSQISLLQKTLQLLQSSHPLLKSKLHYNSTTKEFSFLTPTPTPTPTLTTPLPVHVTFHDIPSTTKLLIAKKGEQNPNHNLSPLQVLLEHELNVQEWPLNTNSSSINVLFPTLYALSEEKCVVVLRFHSAACDRTTAASVLRELMEMVKVTERGGEVVGIKNNDAEGSLGFESMVPSGMGKKTLWAHGMDMLGYSVNSFRLTNLKFENAKGVRCSEVVRLKMSEENTTRILDGCNSRGIKLCGALAAAGIIAAHSTKQYHSDQLKKKYGVVTLTDCRSQLEPPLSVHHYGFYHSAILNVHTVRGNENFWDLAERCYKDFAHYKKCNRHFSDMSDLNFLMSKAIENPSMTASSSLRTSLVSVFEDPVIDDSSKTQQEIGTEDYIGCASVHGVGPSIAFFDTIRNGVLDCACVYPSPLHSREQMNELVEGMKKVLIDGINKI